ncbi:hypothetical protein [Sphingomonas sp. CLY1604]|uniref:hypothetical protein n=1 Tax=Sphingomonas sp. CLY1604 TaxID=3457786 RepID=UPI003FD7D8D8
MTDQLDIHAVNHVTVAINREMSPLGRPHPDTDTLFMGGTPPTKADEDALGRFACSRNYKIVYPAFDATSEKMLPTTVDVVVTDGLARTILLRGGRLWKRAKRDAAVLMFADTRLTVSLDAKGRLKISRMPIRIDERGYETALAAVAARATTELGGAPVVSRIGGLITVLDANALLDTFAKAA